MLILSYVYEGYNEQGNELKRSTYRNGTELVDYELYEWDYEAHTKTCHRYDPNGVLQEYYVMMLTPDMRNVLEMIDYNPDGTIKDEYHTMTDE